MRLLRSRCYIWIKNQRHVLQIIIVSHLSQRHLSLHRNLLLAHISTVLDGGANSLKSFGCNTPLMFVLLHFLNHGFIVPGYRQRTHLAHSLTVSLKHFLITVRQCQRTQLILSARVIRRIGLYRNFIVLGYIVSLLVAHLLKQDITGIHNLHSVRQLPTVLRANSHLYLLTRLHLFWALQVNPNLSLASSILIWLLKPILANSCYPLSNVNFLGTALASLLLPASLPDSLGCILEILLVSRGGLLCSGTSSSRIDGVQNVFVDILLPAIDSNLIHTLTS